jgi:hypothetical protein
VILRERIGRPLLKNRRFPLAAPRSSVAFGWTSDVLCASHEAVVPSAAGGSVGFGVGKDGETTAHARAPRAAAGVVSGEPLSLASAGPDERRLLQLSGLILKHSVLTAMPGADGPVDWHHVAALAHRHRVVPLIWHNLSKGSTVDLPEWLAEDFRSTYQRNALHGLRVTAHLTRIVAAFEAEDIPALPLKGVCLAARYYGNVAARYTGDIDLLVPASDLDRADAILRGLGYLRVANKTRTIVLEPFEEDRDFRLHFIYISRDGVPIELHFHLHNNPDILAVDTGSAIAEGHSVSIGRTTLPIMPDDLQFVFLATHGARHEWVRLQWVCDIAVMIDRARPEDVRQWLATAARHSLTNPVVQAMILAQRLLGIELPPEVLSAYAQSRRIRYMVRRAERTMLRLEERKQDKPPTSFDFGRRLYRMCITGRPVYLWHELRSVTKAVVARVVPGFRSS